ncbi:ATP-binding protein [Streptomonospora nanhaiensis]|uniref:Anti-sigma regulatory factor (Ser/Thr protein kinase) n=1 Tax=Streptomonospora nanhaiensis TaxID=1323731 RepID=A0A853BWB4_9ACTN|nr:ATP-binding protein [Streptomonospora nanhaiensis]MBV2363472.1 ATP-binding protein [Streptomonospora nanhaiensis]NYI98482.1 anti-sigma regulatory factor (Ser/Thr protein kinase) [Streptomonospora nanhaiensis]
MVSWSRMFPGMPAEVAQARAFTRAVLDDHPLAEDAELVVSELASNAVRHSLSGAWCGPFIVFVDSEPDMAHVAVVDLGSSDTKPYARPLGTIDIRDDSGRGLGIVAAVSKEWGFEPDTFGLRVWAKLVTDAPS